MRKPAKQSTGKKARMRRVSDRPQIAMGGYCVHYCGLGGHLWYHEPGYTRNKRPNTPNCKWRTAGRGSTIKFFRICSTHLPHNDYEEEFE